MTTEPATLPDSGMPEDDRAPRGDDGPQATLPGHEEVRPVGEDFAYWFAFEGVEHKMTKLMLAEARAIQRVTGLKIPEFDKALKAGDAEALTALIWVAQKRANPPLRFEDVDGDLMSFTPLAGGNDDDQADSEASPRDGENTGEQGKGFGPAGPAAGGSTRAA